MTVNRKLCLTFKFWATLSLHDKISFQSLFFKIYIEFILTLGYFLCIQTPNTGQLNPLFHTFAKFRPIVNRVVARQSTGWLAANAQFSPNVFIKKGTSLLVHCKSKVIFVPADAHNTKPSTLSRFGTKIWCVWRKCIFEYIENLQYFAQSICPEGGSTGRQTKKCCKIFLKMYLIHLVSWL